MKIKDIQHFKLLKMSVIPSTVAFQLCSVSLVTDCIV